MINQPPLFEKEIQMFLDLHYDKHCKFKISRVKNALNTPKLLNIKLSLAFLKCAQNIHISLWAKSCCNTVRKEEHQ